MRLARILTPDGPVAGEYEDGLVHADDGTYEVGADGRLLGPFELVAYLSERFTFRSGDVVAFGSPANPGLLEPGDGIEITYEGIGTLRNRIGE
jgi:hypothetical protein